MAICRFCGQEFANAQAVRAHLRGCQPYQTRGDAETPEPESLRQDSLGKSSLLGSASREGTESPQAAFDPVRQLEQQIAAEQLRLRLRELEDAHLELDQRTQARERERARGAQQKAEALRAAEREQDVARLRIEEGLRERQRQEQAELQQRLRRRELVQAVKHEVIDRWLGGVLASTELKAQMLAEIEQTLTKLPVEELPHQELIQIAQGVRDRLSSRARALQERAEQHARRQQSLVQHGMRYATQELRMVDGLDVVGRWKLEARVREELAHLAGDETPQDIEEWVDAILEDEGIEYDD